MTTAISLGFQGLHIVTGGAAGGMGQPHFGSQCRGSKSLTRMDESAFPQPQFDGMHGFMGGRGGAGHGSGGQGRAGWQDQLPFDI